MIHLLVELHVKVDLCQQTVPYVESFPVISYIGALKSQAVQKSVMLEEVIFLERRKEAASQQRQAWFGVLKNSL